MVVGISRCDVTVAERSVRRRNRTRCESRRLQLAPQPGADGAARHTHLIRPPQTVVPEPSGDTGGSAPSHASQTDDWTVANRPYANRQRGFGVIFVFPTKDYSSPEMASALVRVVPEPLSVTLLITGLGLSLLAARRTKLRRPAPFVLRSGRFRRPGRWKSPVNRGVSAGR